MSVFATNLIDQAKLVSNNRRNFAIADPDWLIFVNWAIESWYKFRTALDPGLYFATRDVTLAGGVSGSSIDLTSGFAPPGLRAVHGLDLNPDTSQRQTVRGRNFQQRNDGVAWWVPTQWCTVRKYDLRAMTLVITPFEVAAGTYRVYYRAAPYKFSGTLDVNPLDTVLEPEVEAIVKLAAMSALNIEETSTDPWAARVKEIRAEVQAAYERDDGQAFQIADVEDFGNGWGYP